MNADKAREYITHRLCGELTPEQEQQLDAYIAEHPEFLEEVQHLEQVWGSLDALTDAQPAAPAMGDDVSKALDAPSEAIQLRRLLARLGSIAAAMLIVVGILLMRGGGTDEPKPTIVTTGPPAGDVFADYDFPEVDAAPTGDADVIEIVREDRTPRLARSRGLVLIRGPEDKRWRLLAKGADVPFGHRVRVGRNAEFGAILLGADGSTVRLKAGAEIMCKAERTWQLGSGVAAFAVAKAEGKFVVNTPTGSATALGTDFVLYAQPKSTLCEVTEGRVQIARQGKDAVVAAGKSGLMDAAGARVVDETLGSRDWLAALEARTDTDESLARLVAKAVEDGGKLDLEINAYSVDVTVVDGVARTFLDMTFMNNTDSRLEGTFYYSLPADASISEFAMYVGDQRIVGEVLEQQRARQVFEYLRRQQIDPALLEWVGGNLFKMRVYPIEPRSEKRIQLGYTQVLRRREGRVAYTFPLVSEMLRKNPLRKLGMKLRVLSTPGLSDLTCTSHKVAQNTSDDATRGVLAFRATDYTPTRDFNVEWNVPDSAECIVLSNAREDEPEGYFMALVDPRIQAPAPDVPERMFVIVDGSASVDPQSFSIATAFSSAAGDMVSGEDGTTAGWEFNVMMTGMGTSTLWPEMGPVDWGTSAQVNQFLAGRKALGGTDMLAVFQAAADNLPAGKPVHIVYVGDGVDSLGSLEGSALVDAIVALFAGKPVTISCVAVGSSYDGLVLGELARRMGGTFRAIAGASDVFQTADSMLAEFYRPVLRDVTVEFEGIEVGAMYPPELGTLAVGDTGLVLGRVLEGTEGKLVISGMAGDELFRREYAISMKLPPEVNRFLPRLWARAHMDALNGLMGAGDAALDARLRQQVIAVSINYQIMSRYTAFLVLESEEDYKRYGIVRHRRMVDWKGDLAGVTRRRPGVTVPVAKPGPKPADTAGVHFLPEPSLDLFVPEKLGPQWKYEFLKATTESKPGGRMRDGAGGAAEYGGFEGGHMVEDSVTFSSLGLGLTDAKDALPKGQKLAFDSPMDMSGDAWADSPEMFSGEYAKGKGFLRLEENRQGDLDWIIGADARGKRRPAVAAMPMMDEEMDAFKSLSNSRFFRSDRRSGYISNRGWHQWNPPAADYFAHQGDGLVTATDSGKLTTNRVPPHILVARRAVLVRPKSPQARLDLARALIWSGQLKAALVEFNALIKLVPDNPTLLTARAWLLNTLGRQADARTDVQAALAADGKEQKVARIRYAQALAKFGFHTEAAAEYEALAKAEEDMNAALPHYGQAWNLAQAVNLADAQKVWERALARWPLSARAHQQAAAYMQGAKPETALALARKAMELDKGKWNQDIAAQVVQSLFQLKKADEAWAFLRQWFEQADTAESARRALYVGQQHDRARIERWGREACAKADGAQLGGAVKYLRSYGYNSRYAGLRTLAKRAHKADFPNECRLDVWYILGNYGTRKDPAVLRPLFADLSTRAARGMAVQALHALANHGYHAEAWKRLATFRALDNLEKDETYDLTVTEWAIEWNTGDRRAILKRQEALFDAEKDAHKAWTIARRIWQPLVAIAEYERAACLVTEMCRRFPKHWGNRNFCADLMRTLRQRGQTELAKKTAETVGNIAAATEDRTDEQKTLADAQANLRARDYAKADGQLRVLAESLARRVEKFNAELEELDRPIKAKRELTDEEIAAHAARRADIVQRQGQTARLLVQVRTLRPRVAAMGDDLRAAFIAECTQRAAGEDPVRREWTNARLTCLRYTGNMEAYRDALAALHKAEPADPIWPNMLLNATLQLGDAESALTMLDDALKTTPNDRDLLLTRFELLLKMGKHTEADAAVDKLARASTDNPQWLYNMAARWRRQKRFDPAIRALLAVQETKVYANQPNPTFEAAVCARESGDTPRAVELLLGILAKPAWARIGAGDRATQQLLNYWVADEKVSLRVRKSAEAMLTDEGVNVRARGRILLCDQRVRRDTEPQNQHLDALEKLVFKESNDAAYAVIKTLAAAGRSDAVAKFARTNGDLDAANRRALMMLAVSCLNTAPNSDVVGRGYDLAVELYGELIAMGKDVPNLRYQLAGLLARMQKKADEAITQYRLAADGGIAAARMDVAVLLLKENRPDEAALELAKVTQNNQWYNVIHRLAEHKRFDDAVHVLHAAESRADQNAYSNCMGHVIRRLANAGKLAEAEREIRRAAKLLNAPRHNWEIDDAFYRVVTALANNKQHVRAARFALDVWRSRGEPSNGHDSMRARERFLERCDAILSNSKTPMPDDLKTAVMEEVRRVVRWDMDAVHYDAIRIALNLKMIPELLKLAEVQVAAGDPRRMLAAARFMARIASYSNGKHYDKPLVKHAADIRRTILARDNVPATIRNAAWLDLYNLRQDARFEDWSATLKLVEAWWQDGTQNHSEYLKRRAKCLYALKRQDEARKDLHELVKGYAVPYVNRWQCANILNEAAALCRNAKDYALEVEFQEKRLRYARMTWRKPSDHYSEAAEMYASLAGAYARLGETQKALDACLRGLSLIDRKTHHYYRNLQQAMMQIVRKQVPGGLDAVVAHYEKTMAPKGEMPHMRIALAHSYRQEGKEKQALAQFAIAADLLPKDAELRQEVINGHLKLKAHDEVEKALLNWAKFDSQNITIYAQLGDFYEKRGDMQAAWAAWSSMADARPREATGHRALAGKLTGHGRHKQAVVALGRAVQSRPTEHAIVTELATAFGKVDRKSDVPALWKAGEAACRQAMTDLPDDPLPWLDLARFLKSQGRKVDARKLCAKILARPWPRFANETTASARKIRQSL